MKTKKLPANPIPSAIGSQIFGRDVSGFDVSDSMLSSQAHQFERAIERLRRRQRVRETFDVSAALGYFVATNPARQISLVSEHHAIIP
jgi:hypothetical protein